MKIITMMPFLLLCILIYPTLSSACKYGDDPRLETDAAALVQAIHSGQETGQIRMTLATYLGMGPKSRSLFGDQVLISSLDCKPVGTLDGEIVGTATMPFEAFYRAMARAIRKNQPAVAKQLMRHGRVAPMPIEQYVDLFGLLPYKRSGGLKVRDQMNKIFPAAGRLPPEESWLKDQSKQGRMDDYTMARLFNVFGGQLTMNKNCGPYTLSSQFYTVVQMKGLFGGIQDRYVTRQDPVQIMLMIMHSGAKFNDATHYTIKGCTP
ncbi:MAG: hypothetical protein Q9M28_09925 [Mariprofundaceae bacterium]|nr:hypothetical protein [Mariprofundaceae bacterium]